MEEVVQQVSDELLRSLDEESLAKAQQTPPRSGTACPARHTIDTATDGAQRSPAYSHAGQEVADAGEHAEVPHRMSDSAIDQGHVVHSSLPHGEPLPEARPVEPLQFSAGNLLTMEASVGDVILTPGLTAPLEGHSPSPEEPITDALTQNHTLLTQTTHALYDADAGTGSSMTVTPPIAAVTPSKIKSHQRVLPGPGLSLSDASMRPAGRSHKPHALASIASTASVPVASQDPASEGIHVSRVLIGHQNPLYMSSPGGRSDPCTPPENTNDNLDALHNGMDGHADCQSPTKPSSTTMPCKPDMTHTQAEAVTSECHASTSVPCASDNVTELGHSPGCPSNSVGMSVAVTAVTLFMRTGLALQGQRSTLPDSHIKYQN